jgi:hypothetical protein
MRNPSVKKMGLIAGLLLLVWGSRDLAVGQFGDDHPVITPENATEVTQLA